MKTIYSKRLVLGLLVSLMLSACNLPPAPLPTATPAAPTAVPPTAALPEATQPPAPTLTALPPSPTPTEIVHKDTPGDPPGGTRIYDSESYSTASLKYAGNGDWYEHNRFERPFTPGEMGYLAYIDIQTFNLSQDADWFYVVLEMENLNGSVTGYPPAYGVEIDQDLDGRGDFLLWLTPPLAETWSVNQLKVFRDANHDVGGKRPDQADGRAGDGYETLVFEAGQGPDPDLAWARVEAAAPNLIQFAFKKNLLPGNPSNGFEVAVWADASNLQAPAKFAYNDLMNIGLAGSPLKGDANYPLKDLYAVDSTCYRNFLTPNGYAPLLCPESEEHVKRPPREAGPTPPPACVPIVGNYTLVFNNCP